MDFDKFAKMVAERAKSLKLPRELEDERGWITKFFDFFRGRGNIDSILRNSYEKDFEEGDKDKEIFAKILEKGKYIGEDEIQYLLMQILLSYTEPEEVEVVDDEEEPEEETEDTTTDEDYNLPITVDFPKHIENVENILESFLKDFQTSRNLSGDDTKRDVLVLPIKYLQDKAGYDYDPESSREKRELIGKMFIYLYEQLNYFRDRNETREELEIEFNSKFEEYFQEKKNSLESIMLSYKLANEIKFLKKVRTMRADVIDIKEEGNRFKFLKDDLLRMLISQNIPAKINTKDFSEEEAKQAIEVEKTLETLLQKTFDNLYSDSSEQNLKENRLFGVENTFKEKLAVKLYSILYSNKKYRAAYKIPPDQNEAIKKITKAIDSSYNSNNINDDDRELLMKFYKLQWRKFFKPNLYGRTISSLARFYLKNVEITHTGPDPITDTMWESIKVIVEEKTYYLSDVRENTSADEYKFRSVIESKFEAVIFDFSPETVKKIARAFEKTGEGNFSVNSSETEGIQFYKDESEGKNYIYILEARQYLLDNKEKFQGTGEDGTTHGIKEVTNVKDEIEIKLTNGESYKLNSEQWSSLIEALENGDSYDTVVDDEDLEIERKADQEEEAEKKEDDRMIPEDPQDFIVVYIAENGDEYADYAEKYKNITSEEYEIKIPDVEYFSSDNFKNQKWKRTSGEIKISIDISHIKSLNLDPTQAPTQVNFNYLAPPKKPIKRYEIFYDPRGDKIKEIKDRNRKKEYKRIYDENYKKMANAVNKKNKKGQTLLGFAVFIKESKDKYIYPPGTTFRYPPEIDGGGNLAVLQPNNRDDKEVDGFQLQKNSPMSVAFQYKDDGGSIQNTITEFKTFQNMIGEFNEPKTPTQEKLAKLIKPLIREKLKRKQNGKKNLRN